MTHPMVDQLIQMMNDVAALDFNEAPGIKFMASLRDHLENKGFDRYDSEMIAASVDVMLPYGSVTDDHIETLAIQYCEIISKAYEAILAKGFKHPFLVLGQLSKTFSLKLQ
jgi:hypothetical protein